MKVHKHTLPPHVGLKNFVHRYLPIPDSTQASPKQDLMRFARAIRKELVSHQKRLGVVSQLAQQAGLGSEKENAAAITKKGKAGIAKIKEADSSAMSMEISWADGAVGRVQLAKDGSIERVSVRTAAGKRTIGVGTRLKDRETKILGCDARMEGIMDRLLEEHGEKVD